ncbi:SCO0930 family lipoprotein [Streptomyces sp. NBC_00670]|uniref:SCO0930 family lipoprotein n=1 Tax=Streptomyces sp. NBC_00670 TaxID=2975804 RepID=UPI002E31F08A|nr:SCO0930 family lipoprotein [Streptomyces sp. NBC_00670]
MNRAWRSASLMATAAALLALTTACGQDNGGQSTGSQNVGAAAGGYATSSPSGAASPNGSGSQIGDSAITAKPAGKLSLSEDASLGDVVTDGSGMTLYRFDDDTAKPPKSSCAGECAKAWPPVPAEGASAATGIDKSLIGEVTRSDGTKQLTVAGWPMYRYAKDTKAGDTKGEGVGGKWFATAADGKKATLPGLSVRKDAKLGDIVVDKNGMTVYRFMKDQAWPVSKSACTGACLEKWPVVAPVEEADTKGVVKKGLMPFTRPDGAKQMTVNCWPIYTFTGDKAAGDTNGQGVGGTWYAVAPDGKPVGAPKK